MAQNLTNNCEKTLKAEWCVVLAVGPGMDRATLVLSDSSSGQAVDTGTRGFLDIWKHGVMG